MAKAAMPEQGAVVDEEIQQLEESLLEDVPGGLADLYREEGGYSISIIFLPELKNPTDAHVTIWGTQDEKGKRRKLDSFKTSLDEVNDVFRHPTQFSEQLLQHLGGKPKKEK